MMAHVAGAQSPWVAGKNKGYAQLGFTTIGPYDQLFLKNSDNNYRLNRKVTDRTLQLYSEYGINDKLSVFAIVPVKNMQTGALVDNPTQNAGGNAIEAASVTHLGNIQLATRKNFINKSVVLSGQLTFELPTSKLDEATGLRSGLDAFTLSPSVSIGKGTAHWYGFLYTGIGLRTNSFSHDVRMGGELGYQIIKRCYIVAVLDVVQSFENENQLTNDRQLQAGLYLNNQSYFAYAFKGIIGFTDSIGIHAAYFSAASGNVVARAPSVNVGVYYKW